MSKQGEASQMAAEAPPGDGASSSATMTKESNGKRGLFGRRQKKEKAEKAPKEPKQPKVRAARAAGGNGGSWDPSLLSLSDAGPSREQLEREAADELLAALGPSYQLLRKEVPDAASPDDAQRKIESQLGPPVRDNDAELPRHPVYKGDALVYYQLRRHYGRPHAGGSFQRSWYAGG